MDTEEKTNQRYFSFKYWSEPSYILSEEWGGGYAEAQHINLNEMSEEAIIQFVSEHKEDIEYEWGNDEHFYLVDLDGDGGFSLFDDDARKEIDLCDDWSELCHDEPIVEPSSPGVHLYRLLQLEKSIIDRYVLRLPKTEKFTPSKFRVVFTPCSILPSLFGAKANLGELYLTYDDAEWDCLGIADGYAIPYICKGIAVVSVQDDGIEKVLYSDIQI